MTALPRFKADKQIYVTFQRAGLHRYPRAEHDADLKDVNYLGYVHRHLFKFRVGIEVFHNDRELEFHQFLNFLQDLYEVGTLDLDFKSCEMIADDLYEHIADRYPGRTVTIDVSEDGECGVVAVYDK